MLCCVKLGYVVQGPLWKIDPVRNPESIQDLEYQEWN